MSDRLALANAIEDAGINVATKADLSLLRAEVVGMRSATTGVQAEIDLLAHKADVRSVRSGRRGCGTR